MDEQYPSVEKVRTIAAVRQDDADVQFLVSMYEDSVRVNLGYLAENAKLRKQVEARPSTRLVDVLKFYADENSYLVAEFVDGSKTARIRVLRDCGQLARSVLEEGDSSD